MTVVYDAGVLVGVDRNERRIWAEHRVRLELGVVPIVTAPVVSQVSRSARQVPLRRLLAGCDVVAFGAEDAHEVGTLLGRSGLSDAVDAHVVLTAAQARASVVTSDPADLSVLAGALEETVRIVPI